MPRTVPFLDDDETARPGWLDALIGVQHALQEQPRDAGLAAQLPVDVVDQRAQLLLPRPLRGNLHVGHRCACDQVEQLLLVGNVGVHSHLRAAQFTGKPPHGQRLEAFRADHGQRGIDEIAFACGFDSIATFYRVFRATYGMTPGDARRIQPANSANLVATAR